MSFERSFDAWEEVQRHGLDLADRLTQGFTGLIQSHVIIQPSFNWPNPNAHKLFEVEKNANGVFMDIGNKLGQAGENLNVVVKELVRRLPVQPFRHEVLRLDAGGVKRVSDVQVGENVGVLTARFQESGFDEVGKMKEDIDEEAVSGFSQKLARFAVGHAMWKAHWLQGEISGEWKHHVAAPLPHQPMKPFTLSCPTRTATFCSRFHSSFATSFVQTTFALNGMHSLCPAVWSQHRRWLLMSMICLNPLACSFMDLQFPNGQLTYAAGEGLSTSAFLPVFGGLLQAQGQYPGEMRFSFSCKNNWGTRITPMIQWPERSFTMGFEQALAWKSSGLMVKPTVQFSLHPTFGGNDSGLKAELVHSVNDDLNLIGGCSLTSHPSAFASLSVGRSNWNGNVGKSGIVLKVETPLGNVGRPSFFVQLNGGIEF